MTLYQHRFQGVTAAGETWMYTWWANSTRSLANAQAAAVAWNASLWNGPSAGNGYKDRVVAAVTTTQVTTVVIDVLTGLQSARLDTAQVIVGAATGNALPADVALCVSLRTAQANRAGRGRFYLPQPAASNLTTSGAVLPAFITTLGTALANAWVAYNSVSDRPIVYSRTHKTFNSITTFDVGNLYDTQRRRENKLAEARTSTTMP